MKPFKLDQTSQIAFGLDLFYTPIALNNKAFLDAVKLSKHPVSVSIAIERNQEQISTYDTIIFHEEEEQFQANYMYIERLIKSLIWIKGGWKIIFGGPQRIGKRILKAYTKDGERSFDALFMEKVYEKKFTVELTTSATVPRTKEVSTSIGRHLDGCRIGFDAGGSDRKVSAVIEGIDIYSEEIVWNPKLHADPNYHYEGILSSMRTAASKMPRVDGIGVSSAGIYIDNRIMAASLFIKVPDDVFNLQVKNMFIDIAHEMGDVPIEVANDGDVTALAGAMNLNATKVLGIAMGTSQAAGYVDHLGNITGWLNELAFVPVDYNKKSMIDPWSKDYGCGVNYLSQDAVIKLSIEAGIIFEESMTPAEKLKEVQMLLEKDDTRAERIFDMIGLYLGYSIANYSAFYDIEKVL